MPIPALRAQLTGTLQREASPGTLRRASLDRHRPSNEDRLLIASPLSHQLWCWSPIMAQRLQASRRRRRSRRCWALLHGCSRDWTLRTNVLHGLRRGRLTRWRCWQVVADLHRIHLYRRRD